ncbi:MAG: ATP-dependent DNA helicase RecG [Mycobacteriales bacterium]
MAGLDEPLREVVGDRTATVLTKSLDLHTLGDLVYHFPRRYAERGELTDLRTLQVGEDVTVLAQVVRAHTRRMQHRRGQMMDVTVTDGSGTLHLTFFRVTPRERMLQPGRVGLFAGKVGEYRGQRQLAHPEFQLLDPSQDEQAAGLVEEFAGSLIPVYPAAAKIPSWKVANSVKVGLDVLDPLPDPLPAPLREERGLVDLDTALRGIHQPVDRTDLGRARTRLKWDEAFVLQVALAQRRLAATARTAVPRPVKDGGLLTAFDARLPFTLTDGQVDVGEKIAEELSTAHPMHRLLQGEVGSGKTICALRAMLQVVDAGGQAALLAPTEVLAAQHHRSLLDLLGPLALAGQLGGGAEATRVVLLTGSMPAARRREALLAAASGEAGIVVGTHALLYDRVQFADLGLVVVDEQHRFGVEQREALRAKGGENPPHVLVMTATPIPRTVAMTVYGDLETSALRELPRGRSPISSHVVPAAEKATWMNRTWERIREEVGKGHQAYVVCPRIGDDADPDDVTDPDDVAGPDEPGDGGGRRAPIAVLELAPLLADGPLHGLRLGVLHGRLPADEKDRVMRAFAAAELDVLVSTTVVEVGVNVPNATVMAVMDADRFGVSQLHQLRGRVGRGSAPGLCLLVTESVNEKARERLKAVADTTDGFELAELDLEQRREGDVLGQAQSGRRSQLRLLSLLRDREIIQEARTAATDLVAADPDLAHHPALADAVARVLDEEKAGYLEKT